MAYLQASEPCQGFQLHTRGSPSIPNAEKLLPES